MAKRRVARKKSTKVPTRPRSSSKVRNRSGAKLRRPLERLVKALSHVSAATDAAFQTIEDARQRAIIDEQRRIVSSLLSGRLLHDVSALHEAVFCDPIPERVAAYRNVPEAFCSWLEEHLLLAPIQTAGVEMEIPANRMDQFDWPSERPIQTGALVRVRIVSPGWKWRGSVVAKPEAVSAPGRLGIVSTRRREAQSENTREA